MRGCLFDCSLIPPLPRESSFLSMLEISSWLAPKPLPDGFCIFSPSGCGVELLVEAMLLLDVTFLDVL
jgi:hypothetical protein